MVNNELLLLIKKHTDTLNEQTRTKQQETLEVTLTKQVEFLSFSSPINLVEVGKWLLAVTSFEATNSVFNIFVESNSLPITTPGHWSCEDGEEIFTELNILLELTSENDIELHVKEFEKSGARIEIENSGY